MFWLGRTRLVPGTDRSWTGDAHRGERQRQKKERDLREMSNVPGGFPDPSPGGPQGEDPAAPRCRGAFPTKTRGGIIQIPAHRWSLGVRPVRGTAQTGLPGQAGCINGRRRVHRGGPLSSRSGRGVPDHFSAFPGAKLEASAKIPEPPPTRPDPSGGSCWFSR